MRKSLRKEILNKRSLLNNYFIQKASSAIAEKIITQPWFLNSQNIAIYLPIKNEVDTRPIVEKIWALHKDCYLPMINACQEGYLCFIKYDKTSVLINNKFKIPEPVCDESKLLPAEKLDLVIVPLACFDEHCFRLGYGGGYYDRTFAFKKESPRKSNIVKPILAGIAYDLQKVATLPTEPWDVQLDFVFTQEHIYKSR